MSKQTEQEEALVKEAQEVFDEAFPSIREGLIAIIKEADSDPEPNPNKWEENLADQILSHLKERVKQMENPYRAERVMREKQGHIDILPSGAEAVYEGCKQDILRKLQSS